MTVTGRGSRTARSKRAWVNTGSSLPVRAESVVRRALCTGNTGNTGNIEIIVYVCSLTRSAAGHTAHRALAANWRGYPCYPCRALVSQGFGFRVPVQESRLPMQGPVLTRAESSPHLLCTSILGTTSRTLCIRTRYTGANLHPQRACTKSTRAHSLAFSRAASRGGGTSKDFAANVMSGAGNTTLNPVGFTDCFCVKQ